MLMSKAARSRFDDLNAASASYFARHYSTELQETYEATVYGAAEAFVTQVAEDDDEAREGCRNESDDHLMAEYDDERSF